MVWWYGWFGDMDRLVVWMVCSLGRLVVWWFGGSHRLVVWLFRLFDVFDGLVIWMVRTSAC